MLEDHTEDHTSHPAQQRAHFSNMQNKESKTPRQAGEFSYVTWILPAYWWEKFDTDLYRHWFYNRSLFKYRDVLPRVHCMELLTKLIYYGNLTRDELDTVIKALCLTKELYGVRFQLHVGNDMFSP